MMVATTRNIRVFWIRLDPLGAASIFTEHHASHPSRIMPLVAEWMMSDALITRASSIIPRVDLFAFSCPSFVSEGELKRLANARQSRR
jgi:hypothetical protein